MTATGQGEANRQIGTGEADANRARGLAEADIIKAQGFSTAEAMSKKADAWKQYTQAAVMQILIDKLPEIAAAISAPLAKTEKIVIINYGGDSAGASKLTKDVINVIAQLPPAVEALSGVDLQEVIKNIPGIQGMEKKK